MSEESIVFPPNKSYLFVGPNSKVNHVIKQVLYQMAAEFHCVYATSKSVKDFEFMKEFIAPMWVHPTYDQKNMQKNFDLCFDWIKQVSAIGRSFPACFLMKNYGDYPFIHSSSLSELVQCPSKFQSTVLIHLENWIETLWTKNVDFVVILHGDDELVSQIIPKNKQEEIKDWTPNKILVYCPKDQSLFLTPILELIPKFEISLSAKEPTHKPLKK